MEQPQESRLCANNCGFFGSAATNNFCSKCFKASFLAKKIPVLDAKAEAPPPAAGSSSGPPPAAAGKSRCGCCNKKLGLMGFRCRCGGVFCSMHRYPGEHGCGFDYRREGRDAIEKANPIVKADKVDKI